MYVSREDESATVAAFEKLFDHVKLLPADIIISARVSCNHAAAYTASLYKLAINYIITNKSKFISSCVTDDEMTRSSSRESNASTSSRRSSNRLRIQPATTMQHIVIDVR